MTFLMIAFLASMLVAVVVFALFMMCFVVLVIMRVHRARFTFLAARQWCRRIRVHQAATSLPRQYEKSRTVPEPFQCAFQRLVILFAVRGVFETNDIHRWTVEFNVQPRTLLSDVEYADAVLMGAVLPVFVGQRRQNGTD
jgi:hypothetical protein